MSALVAVTVIYALVALSTFLLGLLYALERGAEDRAVGHFMIRHCLIWPVLIVALVRKALKADR